MSKYFLNHKEPKIWFTEPKSTFLDSEQMSSLMGSSCGWWWVVCEPNLVFSIFVLFAMFVVFGVFLVCFVFQFLILFSVFLLCFGLLVFLNNKTKITILCLLLFSESPGGVSKVSKVSQVFKVLSANCSQLDN